MVGGCREGVGWVVRRVGGEEGTSISDVSVESVASAMSACRRSVS